MVEKLGVFSYDGLREDTIVICLKGDLMTQNELIYMLAVAEHGSVSKAAAELYISQPSLSQEIKKVEKEFGQPLFLRTPSGLSPTLFGEKYLQTAAQILGCYKDLLMHLDEFRSMKRGSITFGIPLNLGTCLLPHILPAFTSMYPGITVNFKENNSVELDKMLLAGKTEFSIMHYQGPHDMICYEKILSDPFYLVMPASFRWKYSYSESEPLSAGDLQKLQQEFFIMVPGRQKLRQVADSILEKAGVRPRVRYTTKSMETAKRLVAGGAGVTFLPYSYLNLFSGTEGLACYALDDSLDASWQLVLAYMEKNPLSRGAGEFIRLLRKSLEAV